MINDAVVMGAQPWCNGDNYTRECYLGTDIVSNPNWEEENDEVKCGNCETNKIIESCFELTATKTIKARDKSVYDYNLTSQ